jgi:hypothetical protein
MHILSWMTWISFYLKKKERILESPVILVLFWDWNWRWITSLMSYNYQDLGFNLLPRFEFPTVVFNLASKRNFQSSTPINYMHWFYCDIQLFDK